jgi:hypothetical protein
VESEFPPDCCHGLVPLFFFLVVSARQPIGDLIREFVVDWMKYARIRVLRSSNHETVISFISFFKFLIINPLHLFPPQ